MGKLLRPPTEPTMTKRHTHHPMGIKAMIVNNILTKFRITTPMLPCTGKGPLPTTPNQDQQEMNLLVEGHLGEGGNHAGSGCVLS
jgi:hypothetical protein